MLEKESTRQFPTAPKCSAAEAPKRVPASPGYYAIFIDAPSSFSNPLFRDPLIQRQTTLIYIGIATGSLYKRLVEQDLHHLRPSTFFRGIGAILDYRPVPGSLAGKKNQKNYSFSHSDTDEIRAWIDNHLLVSWQEAQPALPDNEELWIKQYFPVLNKTHNPEHVQELADLRLACRTIAMTSGRPER